MNLDTAYMTFDQWAEHTSLDLSRRFGFIPSRQPGETWQEWALRLLEIPAVEVNIVPFPYYFKTWQEWADAFNLVVTL